MYARVPESFSTGTLQLTRVATAGASTVERREGNLVLGSSTAAEEALIKAEVCALPMCYLVWQPQTYEPLQRAAGPEGNGVPWQVVDVPEGGVVLLLAHHQFLVGLLFVEKELAPTQTVLDGLVTQDLAAGSAIVRCTLMAKRCLHCFLHCLHESALHAWIHMLVTEAATAS